MIIYNADDFNIHIMHSNEVRGRDFKKILRKIKGASHSDVFNKRSMYSLIMEWTVHNVLYKLNIQRDRTRDVDLNADAPGLIYSVLGTICWIFLFPLFV